MAAWGHLVLGGGRPGCLLPAVLSSYRTHPFMELQVWENLTLNESGDNPLCYPPHSIHLLLDPFQLPRHTLRVLLGFVLRQQEFFFAAVVYCISFGIEKLKGRGMMNENSGWQGPC